MNSYNFKLGIIIFICSFPLLWFNERKAVRTYAVINEAEKNCIEIQSSEVNAKNEGKLVFISDNTSVSKPLEDKEIGISIDQALKIVRKVEMFQWVEIKRSSSERDTFGGGETTYTTYSYNREWKDHVVESGSFAESGHHNPSSFDWILRNDTFINSGNASIGAFILNDEQIKNMSKLKIFVFDPLKIQHIKENLQSKLNSKNLKITDSYIYITSYLGGREEIGDIRISLSYKDPSSLSLVCSQIDNTFKSYDFLEKGFGNKELDQQPLISTLKDERESECCNCCACCFCYMFCDKAFQTNSQIDWQYEESLTKSQIFKRRKNENQTITSLLRLLGFICMVGGICFFFSPIYEILQILPFLSAIGKFIIFVFALIFSIPMSLIIIIFAWIFYRPVLAIVLAVMMGTVGGLIWMIVKKQEAQGAAF